MADSVYLFYGKNYTTPEVELALDTDNLQLVVPGSELGVVEHDNIWLPAVEGETLVRHNVKNRPWPVKLLAGDGDSETAADDMTAALNKLERLVARARRFFTEEDAKDSVGLYIKLDGATRATYFTVIDMECTGMSMLDEEARIRGDALATYIITTEPYGYSDTESIQNFIKSPHFIMYDNSSLAWDDNGDLTFNRATDAFICGIRSGKGTTGGTSSGSIRSATIACTDYQSDPFCSYAWVYCSSGDTSTISYRVVGNSSGLLGSEAYDDATLTFIDEDSNTWYRLDVTGTIGASDTTVYVEVQAGGSGKVVVFYMDKCYFDFASTIPEAWCSQTTLNQWSGSTYADEIETSFLDIQDIPGDAEALMELHLSSASQNIGNVFVARRSASMLEAAGAYYFSEASNGDLNAASDGTRINDWKWSMTPITSWMPVGGESPGGVFYIDLEDERAQLFSPLSRVIISCNDANGESSTEAARADFRLIYRMYSYDDTVYLDSVKFPQRDDDSLWIWLDIGVVDFSRRDLAAHADDIPGTYLGDYYLQCKRDSGSYAIACDYIMFLPLEYDAFGMAALSSSMTSLYFGRIGSKTDYLYTTTFTQAGQVGGRLPTLLPTTFQRLLILPQRRVSFEGDISDPAMTVNVQVTYQPRTKTLF